MEKKKTYVLDTTVLIFDPDIFYKLGDVDIVLPLAAIKELDGLKKSDMEHTAQAARKIARTLDRWGSYADLVAGVKLPTNGRVYIYTDHDNIDGLESQADNKILGAASKIKREKDTDVILVTTDTNMRTVARAYGIKADPGVDLHDYSEKDDHISQRVSLCGSILDPYSKKDTKVCNDEGSIFMRSSFNRELKKMNKRGLVVLAVLLFILAFFLRNESFSTVIAVVAVCLLFAVPLYLGRRVIFDEPFDDSLPPTTPDPIKNRYYTIFYGHRKRS